MKRRGPRSTVCCCVTATTLTGIESNYKCQNLQSATSTSIKTYTKALEKILCLSINIKLSALGVLGEVEGGDFGYVLIFSLTFLFLKFERDTTDGTPLDTLHQMGSISSYLFGTLVRENFHNGHKYSLVVPCCEDAWTQ